MMAHKAMMPRHWERISNLTGHGMDVEADNFLLRNLMEAPLLPNKEDIEVSNEIIVFLLSILNKQGCTFMQDGTFQRCLSVAFYSQDICISAVKEKDIEAKLKQVVNDWSAQNFEFSNFKTRGELLLKGDTTGETVALMEDSLMVLGSLMSNR